jgi:C4-dicarboxylate-specific signal transduction histidine kinase
VTELIHRIFSADGFMPHGHCYLWDPGLIWTMVVTDLLIGLAYVSISLSLYVLVRKIRLPFSFVFVAFGLFIGACGATHFMEILTLWTPVYWIQAIVKIVTAGASVITALLLFPIAPKIMQLAETARLSNEHRRRLEETNQKLSENQKILTHSAKMSALGEMAGGIAHEINSPLAIITLHANQLERFQQRGTLTPELITKEAQLIAATAMRIGEIIKGLRAFAREGEKDPFEYASVSGIIHDALVLCQNRFKSYEIEIRLKGAPAELQIECRAVQIGQIILNLLNNAFDAVAKLSERWVEIETIDEGDRVSIIVTDSGKGIAPEILGKLMQPFFTTKEIGKGTGLGLSISTGIADSHHGKLRVETNCPNTRFILQIPKKHPMGPSE